MGGAFRRFRRTTSAAREGWQPLQVELARVDPKSAQRIEPRNVRRVIRALEVYYATGVRFSEWQHRDPPPFHTIFVGLRMERAALYRRIDARVDEQIASGLVEEVRRLVSRGYDSSLAAMSGFGYREIGQYLRGEIDRAAAIEAYKQATRHYARRQGTWFRPDGRIIWLDTPTRTKPTDAAFVQIG